MGLIHPSDLDAWQAWQDRRRVVPRLAARLRGRPADGPPTAVVHTRGGAPAVVAILDATSPTKASAVLAPLGLLGEFDVAVVAPVDVSDRLPGGGWSTYADGDWLDHLGDPAVVLGIGHYLPLGGAVHSWAAARRIPFGVVQHGLQTPYAPPLPPGSHLLAWSAEDAEFVIGSRTDVHAEIVGSELLWEAGRRPVSAAVDRSRPMFLGQLHGAELGRWRLTRASVSFCRTQGAVYRPHPAERDQLSRVTHRAMRGLGIAFDDPAVPLRERPEAVVSVFSTGILEAAARGCAGWAYFPDPPAWLEEFWGRYRMARWGEAPTPAPLLPEREPAALVADWLRHRVSQG